MAACEEIVSEEPLGVELAQRLAKTLQAKPGSDNSFGYSHRDWCGDTVFFVDGKFHVGPQGRDGYPPSEGDAYRSFASEREFVDWISAQSDAIFTGRREGPLQKHGSDIGNQTLSVVRIQKYCDDYFPDGGMIVELAFDERGNLFPKNKATRNPLLRSVVTMAGLKHYGVITVADYENSYLKKEFPTRTFEYVLPDGTKVDRTSPLAGLRG